MAPVSDVDETLERRPALWSVDDMDNRTLAAYRAINGSLRGVHFVVSTFASPPWIVVPGNYTNATANVAALSPNGTSALQPGEQPVTGISVRILDELANLTGLTYRIQLARLNSPFSISVRRCRENSVGAVALPLEER